MSVLFIMPRKGPGLVIVSDDSALLSRLVSEATRAVGLHLYLVPYPGAGTATDYLDGSQVIRLSPRDWQTAVPTSVEAVARTARRRKQQIAFSPMPMASGERGYRGGGP